MDKSYSSRHQHREWKVNDQLRYETPIGPKCGRKESGASPGSRGCFLFSELYVLVPLLTSPAWLAQSVERTTLKHLGAKESYGRGFEPRIGLIFCIFFFERVSRVLYLSGCHHVAERSSNLSNDMNLMHVAVLLRR